MAAEISSPRCSICNDTDCVCPENETSFENPPPHCPLCGDIDCVCPDNESVQLSFSSSKV